MRELFSVCKATVHESKVDAAMQVPAEGNASEGEQRREHALSATNTSSRIPGTPRHIGRADGAHGAAREWTVLDLECCFSQGLAVQRAAAGTHERDSCAKVESSRLNYVQYKWIGSSR